MNQVMQNKAKLGMKIILHVWRQKNPKAKGTFEKHIVEDVSPDSSFLEMLDQLNELLSDEGKEPITFDHDCREGICGACGMVVNGVPHGPKERTTTCQLHMREYTDGSEIWLEPWRATAFPVLKDLLVDRSAFDRIIAAGGYVSVNTGSPRDANETPVAKVNADLAFDAATCIGCGACVAACPNASAMLFTSAKVTHLGLLPQGQAERKERALNMVNQMESEGFGGCTNHGECQASCPKGIRMDFIARMNRDFISASIVG